MSPRGSYENVMIPSFCSSSNLRCPLGVDIIWKERFCQMGGKERRKTRCFLVLCTLEIYNSRPACFYGFVLFNHFCPPSSSIFHFPCYCFCDQYDLFVFTAIIRWLSISVCQYQPLILSLSLSRKQNIALAHHFLSISSHSDLLCTWTPHSYSK